MTSSRPFQYIKGWVEFYKLKFKVTPDVLIPRPETELLVDEVLNILRSERSESRSYLKNIIVSKESSRIRSNNNKRITILDLGTGSGNIAISLAFNLKGYNVNIIASDISQKALKVAKQNARLHNVENKITFIQSNLLDNLHYDTLVYHSENDPDIIVTNLPYIPSARIPYLDCSVKDFEPLVALDGGEDGFELYRKLFQQIKARMVPKSAGVNTNPPQGWTTKNWQPKKLIIIGEVDYTQGELAVNEAYKYFPEAEVETKLDLAKKQRILMIKLT